MDLQCEKGSSSWLTVLPLQDQGFNLNKGEFRDALSLRYGWQWRNVPDVYQIIADVESPSRQTTP